MGFVEKYTTGKIYYSFVFLYVLFTLTVGFFSSDILPNIRFYTNTSDSMVPAIQTGSLLVNTKQVQYGVGDIITFASENGVLPPFITHRIVAKRGDFFVTKGDANEAIDSGLVAPERIVGKVTRIVPIVGYVLTFPKQGFGLFVCIIFPMFGIITAECIKIYTHLNKDW